MKCLFHGEPSCGHPDEYIMCGEDKECYRSDYFYQCDNDCVEKTELCHGMCATGYEKCGEKCVSVSDTTLKDCDGKCQPTSEPCGGECSEGFFKVGSKCVKEDRKFDYYQCEGAFQDRETPCNGVCHGTRMKCRGDRCLYSWNTAQCEGEICIHEREACHGSCSNSDYVACGNHCIKKSEPCKGKCLNEEYPYKCTTHDGDKCIASYNIRDGHEDCVDGSDETTPCFKGWMCNGTLQCINQPCHVQGHDTCLSTVEKKNNTDWMSKYKTYKIYYCAAEDKCKLEVVPCNGKCVTDIKTYKSYESYLTKPENQFACHDGRKCVDWKLSYCDGEQDCLDGSDEICECQGKTDCKDRIQAVGYWESAQLYICKTGGQTVHISKYCDGLADCEDGSDEEGCSDCPGLVRCENKHFTCSDIPCNNAGPDKPDYLDDFTCEANFTQSSWGLCEEKGKEPKCVKVRYQEQSLSFF